MRRLVLPIALLALAGCREEEAAAEKLVRGLKVYEISEVERAQTRRFPGVLEPANLTVLSFEIGGRLVCYAVFRLSLIHRRVPSLFFTAIADLIGCFVN